MNIHTTYSTRDGARRAVIDMVKNFGVIPAHQYDIEWMTDRIFTETSTGFQVTADPEDMFDMTQFPRIVTSTKTCSCDGDHDTHGVCYQCGGYDRNSDAGF